MVTMYICKPNKLDRNGNPYYLIDSDEYLNFRRVGSAAHIGDNGRVRKVVSYNIENFIARELEISKAELNLKILHI